MVSVFSVVTPNLRKAWDQGVGPAVGREMEGNSPVDVGVEIGGKVGWEMKGNWPVGVGDGGALGNSGQFAW